MRFQVKPMNQVFYVEDTDAARFGSNIRACPLYFKLESTAIEVAKILNKEWNSFLSNPT